MARPAVCRLGLYFSLTVACALSSGANAAGAGVVLPNLGNTEIADREMSIEVTDAYVWRQAPAANALNLPAPTDVWEKITQSPRLPVHLNPRVDEQMALLKKDAWWISKTLKRSRPYINYIVERLEARKLPLDLVMIPAVESSFVPAAKSSVAAAGLWQIVPGTAEHTGLERTEWIDERADLIRSTRAALDYLSELNAEFAGDWALTLAAYNAGPGRVRKAIRRNRDANRPTDYWSLDLPAETEAYVPKIVAMSELLRMTPETPFSLTPIPLQPYFDVVEVGQRISLDRVASLARVPESRLRALNAGLVHNVTPPEGPHRLLLPRAYTEQFRRALNAHNGDSLYALPQTHEVKSGDTLSGIALTYGISQKRLRAMNNLDSDRIRIGQKLAVIVNPEISRARRSSATSVPAGGLDYVVKPGDTLSQIAASHRVRITSIVRADGSVPEAKRLRPGDRLRILPSTGV